MAKTLPFDLPLDGRACAWLLWDGHCPLCQRAVQWVRKRDSQKILHDLPYQEAPMPPMTEELRQACAAAVHLIESDGTTWAGGRACVRIIHYLGWRRTARLLSRQPFLWVVNSSYRLVARYRPLATRTRKVASGNDACAPDKAPHSPVDRRPDCRPHVVIVGAGFAGLRAAKRFKSTPVRVTVVDRANHHLFQPLLYQVATAALSAPDIAAPIRQILRRCANVTVLMADVKRIDAQHKQVVLADGAVGYDYLLLAAGMVNHYFGKDPVWKPHAPGLKSLDDAIEIRRKVLLAYEAAEHETDPDRRRELITFVVIGGGPTGVELAGALAEIGRHTLARNFRHFDPRTTRVVLLEGGPRLLPAYPPHLSRRANAQLEQLGVEVQLNALASAIDDHGVEVNATGIRSRTVLWAAGLFASPLAKSLSTPCDGQGRVLINPDLTVPGHKEIFVVGDLAALKAGDEWVPGIAPAAIQMGKHAAENILRQARGAAPSPFHYRDKGMMATIGRRRAVAWLRGLMFSGWIAWLMWLLVHIVFLVGFRNRVAVLMEWFWAYATYQRSARVIVGHVEKGADPQPHADPLSRRDKT